MHQGRLHNKTIPESLIKMDKWFLNNCGIRFSVPGCEVCLLFYFAYG